MYAWLVVWCCWFEYFPVILPFFCWPFVVEVVLKAVWAAMASGINLFQRMAARLVRKWERCRFEEKCLDNCKLCPLVGTLTHWKWVAKILLTCKEIKVFLKLGISSRVLAGPIYLENHWHLVSSCLRVTGLRIIQFYVLWLLWNLFIFFYSLFWPWNTNFGPPGLVIVIIFGEKIISFTFRLKRNTKSKFLTKINEWVFDKKASFWRN